MATPNTLNNILGQVVKSGGERYEVTNVGDDAVKKGYPVKLSATGSDKNITVTKLALVTDTVYGFVVHEPFYEEYEKGKTFTIGRKGTHIALTASEAISRGEEVELSDLIGGVAVKNTGKTVGVAVSNAAKDELVIVELL